MVVARSISQHVPISVCRSRDHFRTYQEFANPIPILRGAFSALGYGIVADEQGRRTDAKSLFVPEWPFVSELWTDMAVFPELYRTGAITHAETHHHVCEISGQSDKFATYGKGSTAMTSPSSNVDAIGDTDSEDEEGDEETRWGRVFQDVTSENDMVSGEKLCYYLLDACDHSTRSLSVPDLLWMVECERGTRPETAVVQLLPELYRLEGWERISVLCAQLWSMASKDGRRVLEEVYACLLKTKRTITN